MAESSTHLTDDASSSPPQEQPSSPPVVLSTSKPTDEKDPSARFRGDGTSFKAKIIGIDDVPESRGDKMCQESILKLKAIVKASGQHKQKIVINVSLSGLKIINLMTAQVMHEHRVDRISFIARDLTDRRAFGYVVGTEEGKHQFFAIKTAKAAEQVVLSLRDLFQVVYDMKKKEMEVAKQKVEDTPSEAVYAVPNNRPVKQPQSNPAQPEGNISTLQKELDNIHQISNSDAFKNPFPENTPTSPNTPGASHEGDLFGMSNLSDISSLSSDFSLASSSSLAADTPRTLDSQNRLKEGRTSTTQSQNFQRTSSGKSAVSWNGTTTNLWSSGRKKRHGSLTATTAAELKQPLSEATFVKKENPTTTAVEDESVDPKEPRIDSDTSKSNHNSETVCDEQPNTILTTNSIDSIEHANDDDVKSLDGTDASFFNDVMAATGLSTINSTSSTTEKIHPIRKTSDTMNQVSRSDSISSVSSSASSKTSTPHKSLSISNLFFRSDKSKSSIKRKHKFLSRQSSGSSVVSISERTATSTTNTLRECKSYGSPENNGSAASLNKEHVRRKSSSSSAASSERGTNSRLVKGFSVTSLSSQPDSTSSIRYESPTAHERIRPTAAMARARPRAALARTVSSADSKNPPMFKAKTRLTSESEDESNSLHQSAFPECKDANSSPILEDQHEEPSSDANSWACFNNDKPQDDTLKSEINNSTEAPWPAFSVENASSVKESEGPKEVWNAFEEPGTCSVDPFSPLSNPPSEKVTHAFSSSSKDPFQDDPFASVPLAPSTFENFDPFEEITLADQQEDPFKNFEAVFSNISSPPDNGITKPSSTSSGPGVASPDMYIDKSLSPIINMASRTNIPSSPVMSEHSSAISSSSSRPVSPSPSPYLATTESPSPPRQREIPSSHFVVSWEEEIPEQNHSTNEFIPNSLNDESSDENIFNIELHSNPPPIPPRPPARTLAQDDVDEILPPSMPPPPLPARSSVESRSSVTLNGFSVPPFGEPPDLPTSAIDSVFDLPSSHFKTDDESDSSNERHYDFPPDSLPPELPPHLKSTSPPNVAPPLVPTRKVSQAFSISSDGKLSNNNDESKEVQLPSTNATQPNFSADLAELSIEGLEPAPGGGAKLTKQEILSGFGQGSSGMFQQQQPNFFTGQQQSAYFPQQQQQQPAYGIPPQPAPRSINAPAHNPFGGGFGAVPQPQTTTMGMFPSGPSPVIPSRPAPMKPPITTPVQAAPSQNPFGDAFGNAAPSNDVLAPVNSQPSLVNGSAANGEMASDPFASLIPGMGSGATDKNDMFKDFQIAKPPQPPPRSNDSVSAYFDDYFRKSVGGVPLDEASNAANVSGQASKPSNDPFAMFSSTDTDQTFNFNGQATYNGPSLLG